MEPPIDSVDQQILYALQEDSRTPITTIAAELNVSGNTVRNRITKLEERGVIEGYSIQISYDHADIPHYYLFVCTASISKREQLAEKAISLEGVVKVTTLMTGTGNIHVRAAAAGKAEISQIARWLDELGLTVEQEHLIWSCTNQPFTLFKLEPEQLETLDRSRQSDQ